MNNNLELRAEQSDSERTIRIGCSSANGYYDKDEDGNRSGYGYDYDQAIGQYAGWNVEYVDGEWSELLNMLSEGKIDMMGFMIDTNEREQMFDFSDIPAGVSSSCLVTTVDNTKYTYKNYEAFDGMNVACLKGNINNDRFVEYCKNNGVTIHLKKYDSYNQVYEAIENKVVDAGLLTNYHNVSNFMVIDRFLPSNFYYVVRKGNTELLNQLNLALNDINTYYSNFNSDLYKKHYASANGRNAIFTKEEMEYLNESHTIEVVAGGRGKPFEYYDESKKKYCGIIPDVLDRISELTGLQFEYVDENQADKDDDLITVITSDSQWADELKLDMTQPFISSSLVVVSKNKFSDISSVALNTSKYVANLVEKEHPEWTVKQFNSISKAMNAVANGECDCTIINNYEADYYLDMGKYQSLREELLDGDEQNLCIGVSRYSDSMIFGILSKSLMMISDDEYNNIIRSNARKISNKGIRDLIYTNPLQVLTVAFIIMILIVIVLVLVYRNRINKQKTLSLERANVEIEHANRSKTDFLSRMSHDIRTPMNAIIGLTSISLDNIDDREEIQSNLNKIRSSSDFLLGLINDVLDMSKIESGSMELRREPYSYTDFLSNLKTIFTPLCEKKNIDFRFEEITTSVVVYTDKVRLNQIFFNILSNAVKYTPDGGTVTYSTRNLLIEDDIISCDYIISDNGIGMSEEFQKIMFQPFAQEDERYTAHLQGTGLGLSITKKLVDLMGGTIEVESKQNIGTTFIISLKFELAKEEVNTNKNNINNVSYEIFEGKKILLVEDHPLNIEIATKLLEKKHLTVFCAEDGIKAVEKFRSSGDGFFDAICMDIRMPNMDGYEATKKIREMDRKDAATIPIIAMTANAYDSDIEECMKCGMNAHIAKPIDTNDLYDTLARLLEKEENKT